MRTSFACVTVAALTFASFVGCGSNRAIRSDGGDAASGDTGGGVGGATGDGGAAGRSGAGGATGSGGVAAGVGGATGSGGAAGRSGSGGAGIDGGPPACGARACPAGQYCCNASCGLCAPIGALCIQIACTDGGITGDASGCAAVPGEDTQCGGTQPPHFYRCVLAELPAPCTVRNIGNVTNTYCCP